MNGLKEGMEYLVEQSKPDFKEHEGKLFSNKEMYRVHEYAPLSRPLEMNTLTSFIDYIKSQTDSMAENMIIHIKSPTCVSLLSSLNDDRQREEIAVANALVPEFRFGEFYKHENFLIHVMAKFHDNAADPYTDKDKILKFVGTGQCGTLRDYSDDGVSQSVTIQKTTTSKEEDVVPNPVELCPYRTFNEVSQPVSQFIFRMSDDDYGLKAALFEADGGAWKNEAILEIKKYLAEQLNNWSDELKASNCSISTNFTIIA